MDNDGILNLFKSLETKYELEHVEPIGGQFDRYADVGMHSLGEMQEHPIQLDSQYCKNLESLGADYHLFTLAPVYVLVGVGFSIPHQIASEINRTFCCVTLNTGQDIFSGLHEWNNLLEGVTHSDWNILMKNVLSICLIDRANKAYWEIAHTPIRIKRPGVNTAVEVSVFVPLGVDELYKIGFSASEQVYHMLRCPPMESVSKRGRAVLDLQEI